LNFDTIAYHKNTNSDEDSCSNAKGPGSPAFSLVHSFSVANRVSSLSLMFSYHSMDQSNYSTWQTAEDGGQDAPHIPTCGAGFVNLKFSRSNRK